MAQAAEKDVVILRQVPRGPFAPSLSPFPMKLETYLRMAKIPYKNIFGKKMSPKTGKIPWVEFNGEILTDSQLIIEHLNKHFNIDTMSHLSPTERAIAHSFRKMLEENLYWAAVKWRWDIDRDGFMKEFLRFPAPLLWYIGHSIRSATYKQGMGRHDTDTVWHLARQDLEAVSIYLGDKPYFTGDTATEVDCALFGMLAQIKWHFPNSPLLKIMDELPNLHAFCERMKAAYWSDWDDCITHGNTKEATK